MDNFFLATLSNKETDKEVNVVLTDINQLTWLSTVYPKDKYYFQSHEIPNSMNLSEFIKVELQQQNMDDILKNFKPPETDNPFGVN